MKQSDLTVVAVRFPDDVLEELDIAAKHLNRKRGPAALELIKVGLKYYQFYPYEVSSVKDFPDDVPRPTLPYRSRSHHVAPVRGERTGNDNIVIDRLKKLEERLAKLEKKERGGDG